MRPERKPLYNKFGFEGSRTAESNVQIYILERTLQVGGVGVGQRDLYSVNIHRLSILGPRLQSSWFGKRDRQTDSSSGLLE